MRSELAFEMGRKNRDNGSKYQMLRVRKIEVERYLKQMEVRA